MIDNGCPACSSTRFDRKPVTGRSGRSYPTLTRCKACGAIFGSLYRGDSYDVVSLHWPLTEPPAGAETRYFDFTVLGSAGVSRVHGWYDPATGLVAQIG